MYMLSQCCVHSFSITHWLRYMCKLLSCYLSFLKHELPIISTASFPYSYCVCVVCFFFVAASSSVYSFFFYFGTRQKMCVRMRCDAQVIGWEGANGVALTYTRWTHNNINNNNKNGMSSAFTSHENGNAFRQTNVNVKRNRKKRHWHERDGQKACVPL